MRLCSHRTYVFWFAELVPISTGHLALALRRRGSKVRQFVLETVSGCVCSRSPCSSMLFHGHEGSVASVQPDSERPDCVTLVVLVGGAFAAW